MCSRSRKQHWASARRPGWLQVCVLALLSASAAEAMTSEPSKSSSAEGSFDPRDPARIVNREEARRIGWPSWAGPYHNFRSIACGHTLVEDLRHAKLVWRSEEVTPVAKAQAAISKGMDGGRHGKTQRSVMPGGGASVVVADGRVFLSYYLPDKNGPGLSERGRGRKWPLLAIDVVLCVDAETGKTLWKKEFPGGRFYHGRKSAGNCGCSPCLYDGKVYAYGTGHKLWALDAGTGEVVWGASLPDRDGEDLHAISMAYRKEILRRQASGEGNYGQVPRPGTVYFGGGRQGMNSVCIGGSVLVHGLHAFDAGTGKRLWSKTTRSTPVGWWHGGREYVVMTGDRGRPMVCLEPDSGNLVWETECGGIGAYRFVSIEGDLAVGRLDGGFLNRKDEPDGKGLMAMWRLGPQGAKLLWVHEKDPALRLHGKIQPYLFDGSIYCGLMEPGKKNLARFEAATGRLVGTYPGYLNHTVFRHEDRLLVYEDGVHIANRAVLVKADAKPPLALGEFWVNPHPPTTPLFLPMTWPYVDGRLYMRGADGIYCYDLRKQP